MTVLVKLDSGNRFLENRLTMRGTSKLQSSPAIRGLLLEHGGKLPFEIRIGGTGHRDLINEPALLLEVDRVLNRIEAMCSSHYTQPALVVISLLP